MIMPLLSGMDTARELRRHDPHVPIIFLTSSPEFALESYEVRTFWYLLKPLDEVRFHAVLDSWY
ncbi:MAG: response regulator, partial [Roseburia inulinivorans]|nr:response regulator [Roseburia inulinivorans]